MKRVLTFVAGVTLVAPVALMFVSNDLIFWLVGAVYTLVLYIASHSILKPFWRKFRSFFGKYAERIY